MRERTFILASKAHSIAVHPSWGSRFDDEWRFVAGRERREVERRSTTAEKRAILAEEQHDGGQVSRGDGLNRVAHKTCY